MRTLVAAGMVLWLGGVVRGQDPAPPTDERPVYGTGTVTIAGVEVPYQSEVGRLTLRDAKGKPEAHLFYVAYARQGMREGVERPLTFVFNGGPGSSAVWLHMGLVGPKRVALADDASFGRPPFPLVPNGHSLIDVTDIVCIDPPTTGYSRAAEGVEPKTFHGLEEDAAVMGRFIHAWVTSRARWGSPKFLMGESYGTTRAAALSSHLQERYGIELAGVVLISAVLDFQTKHWGNDLAYVLILPSYTATAWYHKRLPADLQSKPLREVLDQAERFALGDYAAGLLAGTRWDAGRRRALAEQLARFTGCSREFCEAANLRLELGRFCKELRRGDRTTVGRLDSRFTGHDRDAAGEGYEYDASYAAIQGPYTEALMRHVRDLGWKSELVYEILTGQVNPWNWGAHSHRHLTDVSGRLRSAMTKNPHLRVFVANGYFDLATPYLATEHTVHHLGLEAGLERHLTMAYYEAGHMMYIHGPSLSKLRADLVKWYAEALLSDMQRTGTGG